jgi:hypothetical protein
LTFARLGVLCAVVFGALGAAPVGPIAFVPLDDRPVTYQLPLMLAQIAGQALVTPPRPALGNYLQPGDTEAIRRWLQGDATRGASALVVSSDMLVYGGLVASRLPGIAPGDGYVRLTDLAKLKSARAIPFVGVFGTIMRLAPTGVPALGAATNYYATGKTVDDIAAYANLPDPPQTEEDKRKAAALRAAIGSPTLDAYLGARARNRDVDEWALQMAAEGGFDRIVIGQDDAGPTGLHLKDVAVLERDARAFGLGPRASIEPGADELGMVMLAQAFARNVRWSPTVSVTYSRPDGIALYVRVAETPDADEAAFEDRLASDVAAGKSVAVADLTFLHGGPGEEQRELTEALVARGIAGKIDAFASWNTDANTIGTVLPEAIAVGAGKRGGGYDAHVHAQFMLDRYADDYAFHQFVRPVLNAELRARGIDTTLLLPDVAREAASRNRELLWPRALDLLAAVYPQYRDAGLTITLPWDRTFETQLDVRLDARLVR